MITTGAVRSIYSNVDGSFLMTVDDDMPAAGAVCAILLDVARLREPVAVGRLLAGDAKVIADLVEDALVERELLDLARREGQEELLEVEAVRLLHLLLALSLANHGQ